MNFLLDIDCLDSIRSYADKINVFSVLRMEHNEIRHSNMLAWLLDPSEKHGLGSDFLRHFLNDVISNNKEVLNSGNIDLASLLLKNIDDFTVFREKFRIDILLVSANAKQLIAIENKVGARQSDDQLITYRERLNDEYAGYEKLLLFLTPTKEEPEDEEWIKVTYRSVLYACEHAADRKDIKSETRMLLSNYIEILKRYIMNENEEIERLCREIYRKHRSALDLIYEYRPDNSLIVFERVCDMLAKRAEEKKDIIFDPKDSVKSYIRFTTKDLEALIPRYEPIKSNGWGDGILIKYEVVNTPDTLYFQAQMTTQTDDAEEIRQKVSKIVQDHKKEFGFTRFRPGKWTAVYLRGLLDKKDIEDDPERFIEQLGKKIERLLDHDIKKFESILTENWDKV
jgi:hypothetical protein